MTQTRPLSSDKKYSAHVKDACHRPALLRFPDGSQVQLKIDAFLLAEKVCAIGGWCSEQAHFHLEIDGQKISPAYQGRVSRPDVNAFLGTPETQQHGFACIAEYCSPIDRLFLLVSLEQRNTCIRISLTQDEATTEEEESFPAIFGSAIYQQLRIQMKRHNASLRAVRAALDFAFSWQDSTEYGLCILSGWVSLPDDVTLEAETDYGRRFELEQLHFWPRPDIEPLYGQIAGSTKRGYGFTATLAEALFDGEEIILVACHQNTRKKLCRMAIRQASSFHDFIKRLFEIPYPWTELASLFNSLLCPSLELLQKKRMEALSTVPFEEGHTGIPPRTPEVSVIIPLYGTLDFLTTQILCFSEDDAFFEQAEIIYVIDDPAILNSFTVMIDELYQLYRIPVRWVFGLCNRGFAAANNLGARIARGNTVIFMNSDVFPRQTGWTRQFVNHLETNPDTGIAGCRLLYPDGSLQHAGMRFLYRNALRIWTNVHPFAGCAPELDPATGPTPVPAVTGACMALRREDYINAGGWSTDYIIGDFEDSDLCFKVRALGKNIIYIPEICLVHLERQTFSLLGDDAYRQRLAIYNAVVHQRKWQKQLTEAATSQTAPQ